MKPPIDPPGPLDVREFQYGDLRSLYHTLEPEVVDRLEEAILCCWLRDFEPAIAIFKSFNAELGHHPVIAYQHNQAYWMQWSHSKSAEILQEGLAAADGFRRLFQDSGIYLLLRLCYGTAQLFTEGNLTVARDAMRELRDWLTNVPIHEYTDVQTQCLVRYYHLILNLKNVTTNFDFDFFQSIPLGSKEKASTSLTLFREYLLKSRRLSEARAILDTELGICPNSKDQLRREPIWLIIGKVRLRLAHVLHVLDQSEDSRQQLNSARKWLTAAGAPGKKNLISLLCQLQELKDSYPMTDAGLFINDAGLLKRYEAFSNDQYVQNDGYVISTALCRGIDVALAILEKDPSAFNREVFWKCSKRTERVLEELGDIHRLYINRLAAGDIACTLFDDNGTLIKWHEDFSNKYPTFNLWRQRISACKTLVLIHALIKNEDQALKTVLEIKEISANQDKFWQTEGFKTQSELSSQNKSMNEDILPVAFQHDYRELDWQLHDSTSLPVKPTVTWERRRIKFGSDRNDPSTEMEEVLLDFIKDDFANRVLDQKDLEILCSGLFAEALPMMNSPLRRGFDTRTDHGFGNNLNLSAFLRTLSPEDLSKMLYGTVDSPTPNQFWEQIYETLTKWLLQKSSKPESKRHYLLFQIQNTRHNRTSYPSSSFETQVIESERLLKLIPRLNTTIQEQVSSNISSLKNLVASSKSAIYLQEHGHHLVDTESAEFQEVLRIYKESLEENYGNGRSVRELQTYVNIAQLYFYAALKLDQRALDPFFQALLNALGALEKVRDGWRALQGWKRVENLTLALQDQKTMNIIPWAVAVLAKFPDSETNFRASMIWSMVQAAKSMGLGWLMETSASEVRDSQMSSEPKVEDDPKQQHTGKDAGSPQAEQSEVKSGGPLRNEPSEKMLDPKIDEAKSEQATGHELNLQQTSDRSVQTPTRNGAEESTEKASNNDGPYTILGDLEVKLQQLSKFGGETVFVDWYNGTSRQKPFIKPLIISIAPGQRPQCCIADITWEAIDDIVQKFIHLDTDDLKSKKNSRILYKLNPLVEPLRNLSKPGQVLVFSACGNLHRIPLHALKVDGEVLIRRNPIVYCSSLSALTTAFESRQDKEKSHVTPSSRKQSPSFNASIYGDPPSGIGKEALHATASRLDIQQLHIGEQFDSTFFVRTIQDPSLHILHYHGHANFSSSSPMDQSLSFTNQRLTLREIFDITPGLRAFHATLLGCGSGASKTVVTNDVIGLVPALFHAGAASTVSSLWTFADRDAALYQEYFYEDFAGMGSHDEELLKKKLGGMTLDQNDLENGRVGSGAFVWNLAIANQRAMLKIMEQKPALYHWAGFVLNGWWMMRVQR
ncbi:MAG: hypothetical protein Q9191_003620 [Dirinaria sp. TL-2023a]